MKPKPAFESRIWIDLQDGRILVDARLSTQEEVQRLIDALDALKRKLYRPTTIEGDERG